MDELLNRIFLMESRSKLLERCWTAEEKISKIRAIEQHSKDLRYTISFFSFIDNYNFEVYKH